jgi:hypothetical protein
MGDRPSDRGSDPQLSPQGGSGEPSANASITDSLYGGARSDDPMRDSAELPPLDGEPGPEGSFTESRQVSWFGKMSEAITGVLIGLVLVVATGVLLFWNEGRAVQTSRSLTEGAGLVVDVPNDRVDRAHEGKLIHLQGDLAATRPVTDPALGVAAAAARLVRHVEMYQWKEESRTETVKQLGGGEERRTTYTYTRVWSDHRIGSESFRQPAGHQNPQMRFGPFEAVAEDARLGAFRPGAKALGRLAADQAMSLDPNTAERLRARAGFGPVHGDESALYLGQDPSSPRVGDLRITYRLAPLGPASFVGRQAGDGLDEYQTRAGDALLMARTGLVPAADLFAGAEAENRILTWILRALGAIFMWVGFSLILRPIAVFGDIVPIVGTVLGAGTALASLALTAVLAPIVIAIAWLFHRPLLSLGVLVAGAAVVLAVRWLAQQRRPAARAGPAAAAGLRA